MVRSFPKGSTLLANATSDFLAFLVVVIFAKSGTPKGNKMPYLLRAIVQDATVYFLVIFTSHFVLEMFLLFATVSISAGGDYRAIENSSSQVCSSCQACKRRSWYLRTNVRSTFVFAR